MDYRIEIDSKTLDCANEQYWLVIHEHNLVRCCRRAKKWIDKVQPSSLQDMWEKLEEPGWMIWLLREGHFSISDEQYRIFIEKFKKKATSIHNPTIKNLELIEKITNILEAAPMMRDRVLSMHTMWSAEFLQKIWILESKNMKKLGDIIREDIPLINNVYKDPKKIFEKYIQQMKTEEKNDKKRKKKS